MQPSLIFRLCVALSVVLGLASVGMDLFCIDLISPELTSAVEKESGSGLIEEHPFLFLVVTVPWVVAVIAGLVGVFFFKAWGRTVSLYSTMLSFFLIPFLGPIVSSGLSSALNEVSTTLWGAALALAYFSSVSDRFNVENG